MNDDNARAEIEAYMRRVLDEAPPLSAEQADRIAALLRPAPAPKTAA